MHKNPTKTIQSNNRREVIPKYQKRNGTSGIKGQLYETKLITLIRIRSFVKEYDEFYIGTNLEGIGALDDICIRYKQNNEDVIVFLQAKHRTEASKGKVIANDLWKPTGDFSLLKYFKSYMKIRKRFNSTKEYDVMFSGKFEDLKCYSVIYTSAGNDMNHKRTYKDCSTDQNVIDLIESGEYSDIFQYRYGESDLDLLTNFVLVEEMKCLGKSMLNFIHRDKYDMMLNDCYIRKYHVVLAQSVINVSDINSAGHRTGTFRDDFLNNNDELFVALREILFNEAVKRIKINKDNLKELVQAIVLDPTVVTISNLMQNISIFYDYQSNTLAISNETITDLKDILFKVKINYNVYKEACAIAVKEKLNSFTFKLPITFGNIDISVSDGRKGVKRLEYLAGKLVKIISCFKNKNIIINEELIEFNDLINSRVLDLNGGLGSAVGNLLILSEDDTSHKFNLNYDSLGKNAQIILRLLTSKINDLDTYRLQLDIEGFPKLSLKASTRDIILAKDFFENLWFFTNQAKEDEIENCSKEILENYCLTTKHAYERTANRIRYDAVYFKIYDVIQKWWMSEGESYYLTKDRKFFDDVIKEIFENSLLTILSSVYMKRMKTYDIEFNRNSIQPLCMQFGANCNVVVTEAIILTGIKLVQYFQELNNYAFIELDSPLLLSRNDRSVLKEEIKSKEIKTLIIIYEAISDSKSKLLSYIIKETTSKRLIVVTSAHSYEQLHTFFNYNHKSMKMCDESIEFDDLVSTSQKKILNSKLTFQETEITFNTIIQEDAKHLLTPCILQKIVNNEKIEVGRKLSNPNYEETKNYYVDRQLSVEKESNKGLFTQSVTEQLKKFNKLFPPLLNVSKQIVKLNTFEDINDTVVLIGAAGTGKSSYLTHMSIKTKQANPKIWIVRINLLDYTKEFYRWQENRIKIDRIGALQFICKTALYQKTSEENNSNFNFDEVSFDIEIINNKLVLRNIETRNSSVTFELKVFIDCYNRGNTVLLFDGFDEICPHYKDEITELLKCLAIRSSIVNSIDSSSTKQRMWIASRSYNNIIETLQTEFGSPYDLQALTERELQMSIMKFLKINLNLNELNHEQFMNIDGFFEFMKKNGDFYPDKRKEKMFKYSSFLLKILYSAAMEYFQSEIGYVLNFTAEKCSLAKKWRTVNKFKVHLSDLLRVNAYNLMWQHCRNEARREEAMTFAITPLQMYVALDYFLHKIKKVVPQNPNIISKWDLEANTSSFYKYFLETKLKRIRYEEKNHMNLCNPDVKLAYEREFKDFLVKHKKIAFYATYIDELEEILTQVNIDEMRSIIKEFETAEEKTGVVDYIVNGVPKFIHLTFQEYLTAEYIMDLLKTKQQEDERDQHKLWRFIVRHVSEGVLEFLDSKFECDNELINVNLNDEIKQTIFKEISHNYYYDKIIKGKRVSRIVDDAVYMNLRYATRFFMKVIVDVINEDNLNDFMYFLTRCTLFNSIAHKGWNEISILVLDCIRRIDPSKLCEFNYGIANRDFTSFSNEDIIRDMNIEMNCFSRLVVQRRYHCELNVSSRRRYVTM